MTDQPVIELEGIAKKYRLFANKADRVKEALHPLRKIYHREFWALRDISLSIPRGRTVGIVGVNGSGKSTLLQIISGVLTPSAGALRVQGRIAALLELGAGFNPDLTGRENVVTNGLIMGLDRHGIDARLEAIEAFADIGAHFDQPVKTYSSGMFMRVAFSAAVHVDPDILIVDEALSVGDVKFQEKCFRRFKEFQAGGKTILFVTHDRASVVQFCDAAMLLHHGELVETGTPRAVVDTYTELLTTGRMRRLSPPVVVAPTPASAEAPTGTPTEAAAATAVDAAEDLTQDVVGEFVADLSAMDRCAENPLYNANEFVFGEGGARVIGFLLTEGGRINPGTVKCGATIEVLIKVVFDQDIEAPLLGISLSTRQGVEVCAVRSDWLGNALAPARAGDVRVYRFRIRMSLVAETWFFELGIGFRPDEVCQVRSKLFLIDVSVTTKFVGLALLDADFAAL